MESSKTENVTHCIVYCYHQLCIALQWPACGSENCSSEWPACGSENCVKVQLRQELHYHIQHRCIGGQVVR